MVCSVCKVMSVAVILIEKISQTNFERTYILCIFFVQVTLYASKLKKFPGNNYTQFIFLNTKENICVFTQ